jgi:type I restriction enzyme S subunit
LDLPPLPVQRRIAEILSTLDTAIEQTDELINKLRAIASGLTHDLLTRGVISSGHPRPPQSDAPGLYKKSSLGWIPTEWNIKKCHEICEKITVGIVVRPVQYYVDEGVPALRSANVKEDGIFAENFAFISEKSNNLLMKSQVKAGDIVSVRTGYPGTSAVIPQELSGANCIDILISRPSSSVISEFLALWINSSFGKDQVLRKQGGLAQQHFNVGELRELVVALPPLAEQERILARITAVSERIKAETLQKDKFLSIKNALSRSLLQSPARPSNGS